MFKSKKLNLALSNQCEGLKFELGVLKDALNASKKYGIVITDVVGEIYHNDLARDHMKKFTSSEGAYDMDGAKYSYSVNYVDGMIVTETVQNNSHPLHEHIMKHTNANVDFLTYFQDVLEKARNNLEHFESLATKSVSNSNKGESIVNQIINSVEELSKVVVMAVERSEKMCAMSRDVKRATEIIGTLTENTNILAWNTYIEAARAGGDAKGFAAVADEVRKLANKTEHSAIEISGIIQTVAKQSEDIKTDMANIWDMVLALNDDSRNIKKSFGEFKVDAQQTALTTKKVSNMLFCNLAKLDHAIFVNKLYDYVSTDGRIDFTPEEQKVCRLGMWKDSPVEKQEYSMLPSYSKLMEPHKTVYMNANEIINMSKSSDLNIGLLKSGLISVENASSDVNKALDGLMQEKEQMIDSEVNVSFNKQLNN